MQVYTIGVYGSTMEEFFNKLTENEIDMFVDIRRRRAVRGSQYSFVNSQRLQNELRNFGINYIHVLELAPTNETRELQKQVDKDEGVAKRDRNTLGDTFIRDYKEKTLDSYDIDLLMNRLQAIGTKRVAIFCVEKEPGACHRSLVAERIEEKHSIKPKHL